MNNKILKEDISEFDLPESLKHRLTGKTFIVTGATGLLGSTFVRCLDALSIGIKFVLPVRNSEKAFVVYGTNNNNLDIIDSDLCDFFKSYHSKIDFIVHFASPTSGIYMQKNPVETLDFTFTSTKEMLEFAKKQKIESAVYVSSIEYYGEVISDDLIAEGTVGNLNMDNPRNSYAIGKRCAEFLCKSYYHEYGIPVKCARLTQTFGAGISKDDNRVFAQFARSITTGNDIILHTSGKSAKPYLYSTDCISALIYILLSGKDGESYNVSTPGTYISIMDLALFLKRNFNNQINVVIQTEDNMGYAPITTVNMSPQKLISLGWEPRYDLESMFRRLIDSLK